MLRFCETEGLVTAGALATALCVSLARTICLLVLYTCNCCLDNIEIVQTNCRRIVHLYCKSKEIVCRRHSACCKNGHVASKEHPAAQPCRLASCGPVMRPFNSRRHHPNYFLAKMTVSRRDLASTLPGLTFDASCDASWWGTAALASSRNLQAGRRRTLMV